MVLGKHEIEQALNAEAHEIKAGRLREENPLDLSENFRVFCEACRRGDLKLCQEKIIEGVNINASDRFNYTPLILVSMQSLTEAPLSQLSSQIADLLCSRRASAAIMKLCSCY